MFELENGPESLALSIIYTPCTDAVIACMRTQKQSAMLWLMEREFPGPKLQARIRGASVENLLRFSLPLCHRVMSWWLLGCFWYGHIFGVVCAVGGHLNLQEARVGDTYKETLNKAYTRFQHWALVNQKPSPESLEFDPKGMNELLVEHIQFLFEEQRGVSSGRHAILCIQHKYRHFKTQLVYAWDSVKSWEQLQPLRTRVPLPVLVLNASFAFGMVTGFSSVGKAACEWISWSVGLITSFEALLRPCEWCAMTAERIALPCGRLHASLKKGVLTIVNGKNRRTFGKVQNAIVECDRVIEWLRWLVEGLPEHVRLMPGGTALFRALFTKAVKALGLEKMKITPGSLRAGGATHKFVNDLLDIGKLKFRGRWAVMSTLEHYLQEGVSALAVLRADDDVLDRLESICKEGALFNRPPSFPWTTFFDRKRQVAAAQWIHRRSCSQSEPARL